MEDEANITETSNEETDADSQQEQQEQPGEDTAASEAEKAVDWEQRYVDLESKFAEQGKRLDTLLDSVAKMVEGGLRFGAGGTSEPTRHNEPSKDEKALNALMGD